MLKHSKCYWLAMAWFTTVEGLYEIDITDACISPCIMVQLLLFCKQNLTIIQFSVRTKTLF